VTSARARRAAATPAPPSAHASGSGLPPSRCTLPVGDRHGVADADEALLAIGQPVWRTRGEKMFVGVRPAKTPMPPLSERAGCRLLRSAGS
jgi:hypothetical protein